MIVKEGYKANTVQTEKDIKDMMHRLSGTNIAAFFVNRQLYILNFTPTITGIANLIQSDVLQPMANIVFKFVGYDSLMRDTQKVLDNLVPKEMEVQTTNGKWYNMCIQPYYGMDKLINGMVITFIDITEMHRRLDVIQCCIKDFTDVKRRDEEKDDLVSKLKERVQELGFKNRARSEREMELIIANKEISFQNHEMAEQAAELIIANKELTFQNQEKAYKAAELIIANKELTFQNQEKAYRAAELIIANKELAFQNQEKADRAAELIIANKELTFQNQEKADRAAELIIANKELTYQNQEKAYRAAELIIANKELAFQNQEKADRAAELIIANKELIFQNQEKAYRAAEKIIANKELAFQNHEKEDRAAELIIINKEHNFQNQEKADKAAELIIANAYLENLINYANAPIIVLDLQLHITHFNHAFEAITGRNEKEVIGKSVAMIFPPAQKSKSMQYFKNSMKEKRWETLEIEIIHVDGSVRILLWNSAIIYDVDGITPVSIIGQGQDITDWKKAEEEILYLSYHDQLTGLYNRRFYEIELSRLDTERNFPLTIVMGDVNGLKLINDSFGHAIGDELLKRVGEVLRLGCRADDIIARLAGDEFVVILPKTDIFETEKIIKRITDLLLNQKVGSINISISFGYGSKNNEEEKIQDIFKKAEDHMYKKKIFESASIRAKTINVIINTLYEKSKREEEHSHRVSELCKNIGEVIGLPEHEIEELKLIGLIHDIGKIAIDENILNKPGKLTEDEFKEIKRHPEIAFRILNTVNDISDVAKYVLYHHERWDGKGYPKGLKGVDIPFVSRIIAIADAYDAMTSDRSYRRALPQKIAIEELQKNAGTQFDSKLVTIFIEKIVGKINGV